MKKDIHIVYDKENKCWHVKRETEETPLKSVKLKKEAQSFGREVAKVDKVELVIHKRNGKISDSDSYGNEGKVKDKVS